MRARTYLGDIEPNVLASLQALRTRLGDECDNELLTLETFVAVGLRVMKKSNPSKVVDEARTVEIGMRLRGREQA